MKLSGSTQIEHLVRMASQIALNMAAWGSEEEVAKKTAEHITRFWTPVMRQRLLEYAQTHDHELPRTVVLAVSYTAGQG